MSEIQRWNYRGVKDDSGKVVAYADHVAIVAKLEARAKNAWMPITPDLRIDTKILLGKPNGISLMAYQYFYSTGADALDDNWTHFRVIAPPEPSEGK